MRRPSALTLLIISILLYGCGVSEVVLQARDAAACDGCGDATPDGGTLDLVGPPNFDPGPCSVSGWCWVLPTTTGNTLSAIWGSSASDVYAVGDARTILHFDGTSWEVVAAGVPADDTWHGYHTVWGFSPSDVFVGGDDGLLHFDGTRWHSHGGWPEGNFPPKIHALWGSSRSALYAVGGIASTRGLVGNIRRFDGSRWSVMETPLDAPLNAVWGFSATDVFAAGDGGAMLRLQDGAWQTMASGTEEPINTLWGASPSQLFAGTQLGSILRFDGQSWSKIYQARSHISAIWGRSATDINFAGWEGILHYDGTGFTSRLDPDSITGLWGTAGDAMLAVGGGGKIYLEEGTIFTQQVGSRGSFSDVWARSATEVYIAGYEDVFRWDGTTLSSIITFSGTFPENLCGQPSGALIVAGPFEVYRRDATGTWTNHRPAEAINDLWCSSESDDAVIVGWNGLVEHFDGTQWTRKDAGVTENFEAVWGSSPTDVYAVEWQGDISRYDGTSWALMPNVNFGPGCSAIAGRSATEIYVLSSFNIETFDGVERGLSQHLTLSGKAIGGGGEHLFAADGAGNIYQLQGTQWVAEASPIGMWVDAFSVQGQDAWAAGPNGMLLHRKLP